MVYLDIPGPNRYGYRVLLMEQGRSALSYRYLGSLQQCCCTPGYVLLTIRLWRTRESQYKRNNSPFIRRALHFWCSFLCRIHVSKVQAEFGRLIILLKFSFSGEINLNLFGFNGVSKRSAFIVDETGVITYSESSEGPKVMPNFEAIQTALAQCELLHNVLSKRLRAAQLPI